MRIVLVNVSNDNPTPPQGLCYISAYLKKYSHFNDIRLFDSGTEDIYSKTIDADIMGITCTTKDYVRAIKFAQHVKSKKDIPIIIGGTHISTISDSLEDCFDVGVIGEGEQTFLELMSFYEKHKTFSHPDILHIKGICFMLKRQMAKTDPRPFIEDLDSIPFPDLHLVDIEHYMKPRALVYGVVRRSMILLTSRGCPYHCSFCSTSSVWHHFRGNSAEYVVAHIKHAIREYRPEVIQIFDDLFIYDKKRLKEIVELIEKEGIHKQVKFGCLCRADILDEDTIKLLKRMNVIGIAIGMESGSQKILNYLKNNTTKVEHLHRAADLCEKYKIGMFGSFMLGNLGETEKDMMATLDFIKAHPKMGILNFITTPVPGTKLWDDALKAGKIDPNTSPETLMMDMPDNFEDFKHVPLLTDMDRKRFFEIYQEFQKEFVKRYARNYDVGNSIYSVDYLKRAVKKPRKAFRLVRQMVVARVAK